jgi:sodium transport system permease protein
MFLDGKLIPEIYIHIPILNTISILKELLIGVINIPHILMVFGWGVVYVAIALFLVNKMIHKEKVVFRN